MIGNGLRRRRLPAFSASTWTPDNMSQFSRPAIRDMAGYIPGEQPRDEGSSSSTPTRIRTRPRRASRAAVEEQMRDGRLRKYPDPLGTAFRRAARQGPGRRSGGHPDRQWLRRHPDHPHVRFVPEGGLVVSPTPSYLLYKTLAEIQVARFQTVPFTATWDLPDPWPLPRAHLTLVANPNSPTGTVIPLAALKRLASVPGPLVVDEAYVDFAPRTRSVCASCRT